MWGLLALVIVLLLVGCALALGDNSRANVNVDHYPSVNVDTADGAASAPSKEKPP
jgi:hypothetical protein